MANDDDAEARQKRAARLRAQIASLTGERTDQPGGASVDRKSPERKPSDRKSPVPPRRNAPSVRPPSPRDFVERRMRELDAGNQNEEPDRSKK